MRLMIVRSVEFRYTCVASDSSDWAIQRIFATCEMSLTVGVIMELLLRAQPALTAKTNGPEILFRLLSRQEQCAVRRRLQSRKRHAGQLIVRDLRETSVGDREGRDVLNQPVNDREIQPPIGRTEGGATHMSVLGDHHR